MTPSATRPNDPAARRAAPEIRSPESLRLATRALAEEQRRARGERLRQTILIGFAVSLPFHAILLAWLGAIVLQRPVPGDGAPVSISLAPFVDEQLSEFQDRLPDAELSLSTDDAATSEALSAVDSAAPAAPTLAVGSAGDLALGGGAGDGSGLGSDGLGGGAGGAGFFGVTSRGNRFAYIVDISGSMSEENRWPVTVTELMRSLEALPDHAYFHVVFFSSTAYRAPWQEQWIRAQRNNVTRMRRWVNEQSPGGGTFPVPAFAMIFALDVKPDVIFFMTDGIIPTDTPEAVARMNSQAGGRRVVINTIALGEQFGHDLLIRIAEQSNGTFRYVPTRRR